MCFAGLLRSLFVTNFPRGGEEMGNFLQRLRTAWHFWQFYPQVVLPPGYWRDEDARALSNFLCSDTGIKLRHIWVDTLHAKERQAIQDPSPIKFTNGVAWGCRAMISVTDNLLLISPSASGSADLTERDLEATFRSVNR